MNNHDEAPEILNDFLKYMRAIRDRSETTVHEYFLDLRTFLRFIKVKRGLSGNAGFDEIDISDVDAELIRSVKLSDLIEYVLFLREDRPKYHKSVTTAYGDETSAVQRKIASLRSFFSYLQNRVHLIEENPVLSLDIPRGKKTMPKYLTFDESVQLLSSVDGAFQERDYCIITIFLNCGLRVSELAGLNLQDVNDSAIRVRGKGDKERIISLNDAVRDALTAYLPHRIEPKSDADKNALFTSRNRNRINVQTVKMLVNKHLKEAGLEYKDCSAHKLRHTAATLMYQNGVDIRTLQEFLGHEQLNTTMIYTHVENAAVREAVKANPLADLKAPKREDNEQ
jgi:site-specific recombinase XerD